jgi:hypothetical protein
VRPSLGQFYVTFGLIALAFAVGILAVVGAVLLFREEPPLTVNDRARVIALFDSDDAVVEKLSGLNNSGVYVEQTCRTIEFGELAELDNWAVSLCTYAEATPGERDTP